MDYLKLKNGDCRTTTGIKEVSFDPETLEIRPVLFRVYSGYQPDRGTIQGVLNGDIVAQCTWNARGDSYRIYKYGMDNIPYSEQPMYWAKLKEKHPWLDSWLEPSGRSETIIPEEVCPVHEYVAVKVKTARIENCLNRFGITIPVSSFLATRRNDLELTPKELDIDLDTYIAKETHWTGELVNISSSEEFYGSAGIGKPAVKLEIDPDYESGSNYGYIDVERKEGKPGVKGWQKWKYIIHVRYGIYEKDHSSYGVGLKVYDNKKSSFKK